MVVLNYNGGDFILRCLEHLTLIEWPTDRLEIVVVDNASSDGSPSRIKARFPDIAVRDAGGNLGFAGGNNVGLQDLADIDYVALLNNDAFVEANWLAPLVRELEKDPGLGAVNSKIVFSYSYADLAITSETFTPSEGDGRSLGLRISGVRVDGEDRFRKAHFVEGFYGPEHGGKEEVDFQWTGAKALLRIPVTPGRTESECELRVAAERTKAVGFSTEDGSREYEVTPTPTWVKVPLPKRAHDVINNVGSELVVRGYGGDRGFLARDVGQFEEPAEVFAWCGCSALFRKAYLEDVGLFDEHLFLYYEDFDLSWRGRRRGWRYLYVPDSVVRHFHTATSQENSPLFQHFVHRNRMLVLIKNAPASLALQAITAYVWTTIIHAINEILLPTIKGRRPSPGTTQRRLRAFASFIRLVPWALRERMRISRTARVSAAKLMEWVVER